LLLVNAHIVKKLYGLQVIIVSDYCFKEVNWRKVSENGTIVELSRKENDVFCITEFENKIRVMGKLDAEIHMAKPGQTVKLTKCLFNDKNGFFFSLENKQ